jgi:Tfp pilus assembly protein PilO
MSRPRVRYTLIAGLFVVLAAAAAVWFILVSPRMSQASTINGDIEQVALANSQMRARYAAVVKQAAEAPTVAAQAQAEFSRMPEQANLPGIITELTDAARSAGIPAESITNISTALPQPVVLGGPNGEPAATSGVSLARMEIAMSATGTPAQILDFIKNLETLDRALLIKGTTTAWQRDPDKAVKVTATVLGTMFVLQSKLPDLVKQVESLLTQASVQPSA